MDFSPRRFGRAPVCFYLIALMLVALYASARAADQSPIDGRSAADIAALKLKEQNRKTYASLAEVPDPGYIRKDIPSAKAPAAEGKTYEALIPDTLDLAERARLFIHHLSATTVAKTDYEPVGSTMLDALPPRIQINANESICAWPKYRESLPLTRLMCGSRDALEIDKRWAEVILHSIGPDGLFYVTLTGRPWDTGAYPWVIPPDGGDQYAYLPTCNGRLLGALGAYYKITGDEVWKKTGEGIVDRLNQLAIWDGKQAFFPKFVYFPNEKLTSDQIEAAKKESKELTLGETEKNVTLWQTWLVTGLSQFYRSTGYEPAGQLARGLLEYIIARRYTPEGHWDDHHHCGTLGIHAMCELALATNDRKLAEFARKCYEWGKSEEMGAIPQIGYFAVMQHQRGSEEPMEPCSVADMTAIALKLNRLGMGDYWDDVDHYVRNMLVEAQITHPAQIADFCRRIQDKTAVGNYFWKPNGAKAQPVAYNQIADTLPEKMVGFFSTTVYPNEQNGWAWSFTCCTGNATRAMYYAWENIVSHDAQANELKINLLLNRASPWADVDSYLPYTGRIEVKIKTQLNGLQIRMNDWISKDQVACLVNDKPAACDWNGRYLKLGAVQPNDRVVMQFPISEHTEKVHSYKLNYTVTFRGSDVVAVDPPGRDMPLFQRGVYRTGEPRYVKVQRFACANAIDW
jgi:hypothetical protein